MSFDEIINCIDAYDKKQDELKVPKTSSRPVPDKVGEQTVPKKSLRERLENLKTSGRKYSDVISKGPEGEELQWVNFVQEGGGTLGIALAGYAFVLEYMGIRFLKLAGTSAGAINTIFLAAIGNKNDPKTPELYDILTNRERLNLKSFVDADSKFVKWLLFSLGKGMGLLTNLAIGFLVLLLLVLIPLPLLSYIGIALKIIYWILLVVFLMAATWISILVLRLSKYNFGINPGIVFKDFLKTELAKHNVHTKADLDKKAKGDGKFEVDSQISDIAASASANLRPHFDVATASSRNADTDFVLSLSLRPDVAYVDQEVKEDYQIIEYDYSFVSTDIANQRKVVFPKDADLYFDNVNAVSPVEFVRASMAIPIFFEPQFFPIASHTDSSGSTISDACKEKWEIRKNVKTELVGDRGILIDGGSLSNFPINLFHKAKISRPRLPIMGVRIIDEEPVKSYQVNQKLSLGFLVGSIINTLRSNEDITFLTDNPFYSKFCIGEIKAFDTKINWLNFDLKKEEKDLLFMRGVEAALTYLENFNWEEYKLARASL